MSLRHQTNKRLAAGLGSTTHPGCTRGSGCAGSILLRSHHSPCPSPPCTASHAQSPSASPCAVRGLPRACACTRAMACGWGVIYMARSCASNPVCVAPMRMHMRVYDIRSQSDSVLRVLVFSFLFVLGVRLKRCWKWPSASEVARDLHDCRFRSLIVPFSLPPTFSGTGSQIAVSKRQSACAGRSVLPAPYILRDRVADRRLKETVRLRRSLISCKTQVVYPCHLVSVMWLSPL